MTNEYGVQLDSNGYAPSVIQFYDSGRCFMCGKRGDLARHEVFHGSNRTKSKALGCWVYLCPKCHTELHGKDGSMDWELKTIGQRYAMTYYDWTPEEFRERFGRTYGEQVFR